MTTKEPILEVIEKSAVGSADEDELNSSVGKEWRELIVTPTTRREIAELLHCDENLLDPDRNPFKAEVAGSGAFGAEILVAVLVGIALELAKEGGSAATKHAIVPALRSVWNRYLRDRVSPPGSRKMGARIGRSEED